MVLKIIPWIFILICFGVLYIVFNNKQPHTDIVLSDQGFMMKQQKTSLNIKKHISKLRKQNTTGLPLTWCGQSTYSDLPGTPSELHFKVLYAIPKGSKNRLHILANHIQADVVAINLLWAKETRGMKTIRWDMGTSCGKKYVDIMIVNLPHSSQQYISGKANNPAQDISNAVVPMLGPKDSSVSCDKPTNTHALVYIDGSVESGMFSGIGYGVKDKSSTDNENDCGGGIAIVEIGKNDIPTTPWLLPNTAGHEMLHALGASQNSPNATREGHCIDEHDLLCYDDGTKRKVRMICKNHKGIGPIAEGLDCGNNDYFSAPGEEKSVWLKNNWNIYNSKALQLCQENLKICQGRLSNKAEGGDTETYSLDP